MENRREKGHEGYEIKGFDVFRQFYHPDFDMDSHSDPNRVDTRSTLYWNPFLQTNSMGEAVITFYNSDVATQCQVDIQGISNDGNIIHYLDLVGDAP